MISERSPAQIPEELPETPIASPPSALPEGRGEIEPRSNRATRFRPGQSGNPSGVAKSPRISKLVARALQETVDLTDKSGATRTLSKLELTVTQLVNRAATGDRHATQLVFSLLREEQARPDPSQPRRLDENDDLVIADLVRTLSRPLQ